jgi:hypothetical protein
MQFESHLGHSVSAGQWPNGPLTVDISSFLGPFGGLFCWRPLLVRMAPFPWVRRRLWACYFFMVVRGLGSMTCLGGEKGCLPPPISCSAARAPDVSVRFGRRSDMKIKEPTAVRDRAERHDLAGLGERGGAGLLSVICGHECSWRGWWGYSMTVEPLRPSDMRGLMPTA